MRISGHERPSDRRGAIRIPGNCQNADPQHPAKIWHEVHGRSDPPAAGNPLRSYHRNHAAESWTGGKEAGMIAGTAKNEKLAQDLTRSASKKAGQHVVPPAFSS